MIREKNIVGKGKSESKRTSLGVDRKKEGQFGHGTVTDGENGK